MSLANLKILVIDDDPFYRRITHQALMSLQVLRVIEASGAEEGLTIARMGRPDVVLCDLGMSPLSGLDFLDRVRADPAVADLPVVMLTSHAEQETVREATRRSVDGYVLKPASAGNLRDHILAAIRRRSRPEARMEDGLPVELERQLEVLAATCDIPALSLAVVRTGQPPLFWQRGRASLAFDVEVTNRSLFNQGSVGDHLLSVLVLMLVEQGALLLDEPIGARLPDLPSVLGRPTLDQVLRHVSGLPDNLAHDRPWFAPGTSWAPSPGETEVLVRLVERATGMRLAQAITRMLLRSLALPLARIDEPGRVVAGRAEGYRRTEDGGWMVCPGEKAGSTTGVLMSAMDAAIWEMSLRGQLLSDRSRRALFAATQLNGHRTLPFGMGWNVDEVAGRALYWQSGVQGGHAAAWFRRPAAGLSVHVMASSPDARRAVRRMALLVMERMSSGATPLGLFPMEDPDPGFTNRLRRLLTPGDGTSQDLLAPDLRPGFKVNPFRLDDDAGLVPLEIYTKGGTVFRRYRTHDRGEPAHLLVGIDGDGRIGWLSML
ncbi:MAG: hypothetical protein RLY86_3196 [Pseudomonadota bacterium]|jgi:two-component system chemotaxis response regulator CheY